MTKKIKQTLLKTLYRGVALFGACGFVFAAIAEGSERGNALSSAVASADSMIRNVSGKIDLNTEQYFDNQVVSKIPETVGQDEEISVIVTMNSGSLIEKYQEKETKLTLTEFVSTSEAKRLAAKSIVEQNAVINLLNKANLSYTLGERYDTVLNGFEVIVKAADFYALEKAVGDNGHLIIGEVYEPAAVTEVVTNEVDVYETGIFDSSDLSYQGDGVVVAVLDTGLDYTHSAFDSNRFESKELAFSESYVSSKVKDLAAANMTKGLTGSDLYMNKKVPFAYDYADKDVDVLPINSSHGTHVAGIIAGHDDEITGVAPNAQLAIMKVFSDGEDGAKDSWLLAALEDCVALGVDVINMSLGSSCGFAREADKDEMNAVYDRIHEAGISMICAASNDGSATTGSEKNGSLSLTSNPDFGTVGSPSTYEATLSVASVDGVKTPYFKYGEEIIYFKEAVNSSAITKDFVNEVLDAQEKIVGKKLDSYEFEYVTISGIGRETDYEEDKEFYEGKIVLVKRGTTTFEDKIRIGLQKKGAIGVIIYNNVSGEIAMSVGKDYGATCSISQDEGEMLAENATGKIFINRKFLAGPFMSSFSSWGPTSGLAIKPEITAHGGEIYSAVPGGGYERMSGTSMAAPNQAGATALIRQYVKDKDNANKFGSNLTSQQINAIVYQLMMSSTDIVYNKNGIPFAVRKQGSGLVNMKKAIETQAYIITSDKNGEMEKTKLELGDDKQRTGVYDMTFEVRNISNVSVTYDVDGIIQTEGISETRTGHGEYTVTQEGYLLNSKTTIIDFSNCSVNGNTVTVAAGQKGKITVQVVLSDADKAYMNTWFENGMYVEGFITLKAKSGATVDLSVPVLAFYGDWTEAPIFDEEYYDTHKDEINTGLNPEDKLMPDAYATRAIGKLYSDYIAALGSYYFVQDPKNTKIAANKDYIAISNQDGDENEGRYSICSLDSIYAGLLRNVKQANISIVDDVTGKEIFSFSDYNIRKSRSSGSSMYPSFIDVEFDALSHKLKNNTKYTVTVETFIDYGEFGEQKNDRNVFTFPLYIDFQAPALTDVRFYTEYDQAEKKTRLYADLNIYDNHYAMGLSIGQIVESTNPEYLVSSESFGQYITPVYSAFNSTSIVKYELTDYITQIKNGSLGLDTTDLTDIQKYKNNSFIVSCYDYAMNASTYEVRLPDEVIAMYFEKDGTTLEHVNLSPNEMLDLTTVLNVYPATTWKQIVEFTSKDASIADVVNQTLIAKKTGITEITASGYNKEGEEVKATLVVNVLGPNDEGYRGDYTLPEVNKFEVYGYKTLKAYYALNNDDREIGTTDSTNEFDPTKTTKELSMYPSESVELLYTLNAYVDTKVTYTTNNPRIATVDPETGVITALAEGSTSITATASSYSKQTIRITVKDPYETSGMYLLSYKGLGGEVVIPDDRGITEIYAFAFSNSHYVERTQEEIDEDESEDPNHLKQWYIGEDTITKIVIPEGVEIIQKYAFANLSALEEVVLPSTLTTIGVGAFYNCQRLTKINLENVQFINEKAFAFEQEVLEEEINDNEDLLDEEKEAKISKIKADRLQYGLTNVKFNSIVAIGNYSFKNCALTELKLPLTSQSVGEGAFYGNKYLATLSFEAPKMKIGPYAFAECSTLDVVDVNAAVISSYAFYNCAELTDITLGSDVAVLGEYAFTGTNISAYKLKDPSTSKIQLSGDGAFIIKDDVLMMVAPQYTPEEYKEGNTVLPYTVYIEDATEIAAGAFAGALNVWNLIAPEVKTIGDHAFAGCKYLNSFTLPALEKVGNYAFAGTELSGTLNGSSNGCLDVPTLKTIGNYAFAGANLTKVVIAKDATIGDYAFSYYQETENSSIDYNDKLRTVILGDNVTVGTSAFYAPIYLATYDLVKDDSVFDYYYEKYPYTLMDEDGNVVKDENGRDIVYVYLRYNFKAGVQSMLNEVTIGKNCELGEQSFAGNAKLSSLSIGEGTSLGNYAFFNATDLTEVDLKGVTYFGDYAFGGSRLRDYWIDADEVLRYALNWVYDGEENVATAYMYSDFAPKLETADLSSATYIGFGAFAGNSKLSSVKLGENLAEISDYAFATAKNLTEVELPESVTSIGAYAFYGTSIESINLENVSFVGDYAFANTYLSKIAFASGAVVGEGSFMNCEKLAVINNLENVSKIGAYAFQKTAITSVNLSNVESLGDYAFGGSQVTEVEFGTAGKLLELGDNPFYGCEIDTYGKKSDDTFNQTIVGTNVLGTYDVSEKVKVIDGVLYQLVPNGLVLISYPAGNTEKAFVVPEGIVRIGASAFRETNLENVTLPSTLKSLGDKAFFGCESLLVVVFKSYEAPTLEEEYDEYYVTYEHLPLQGNYYGYEGMGVVSFYMWNITTSYNNFYFGANFLNYIGQIDRKIIMVKPVNGQHYETFILSQYFGAILDGSSAPMEETVNVIALIASLPTKITLANEAQVVAARKAFESMSSFEQKSLVTNLEKLENAESMINYLKLKEEQNKPSTDVTPETTPKEEGCRSATSGWSMAIILLLATAVVSLRGRKGKNTSANNSGNDK